MALKSRTRGWLDAVSGSEMEALRDQVERLAEDLAALRERADADEARQRRDMDGVRTDLAALADRVDVHAGRTYATVDDLAEVAQRIDLGDDFAEPLRLKLAGLTEQLRWESEDLRKGLAAIIEGVERQRRIA